MKYLFIHQNFPGQFKHLAPSLASRGHDVVCLTSRETNATNWKGVRIVRYASSRQGAAGTHPWVADLESKTILGEACFRAALQLKVEGFSPDAIIAHPGWGESLFLKEAWPSAKLGIYCEFYYSARGGAFGFDPEFPSTRLDDACRIRLMNINNMLHFDIADRGLSPTSFQADTFPAPFRKKISVIHDGIDTTAVAPRTIPSARLTTPDGRDLLISPGDQVLTFANRDLEPLRGYHIFMRALPEILARQKGLQVLIVGGAGVNYGSLPPEGRSWRDIFIEEVRPQMSEAEWARVHFLGKVPYETFVALLQMSTVHAYLTYPFVLGWSLLEAMSAGCAIVASDTEPVREALASGQSGRLIDFFDVKGLVEQVCGLLESPSERKHLGQGAREIVRQRYDLQTVCLPRQLDWIERLSV